MNNQTNNLEAKIPFYNSMWFNFILLSPWPLVFVDIKFILSPIIGIILLINRMGKYTSIENETLSKLNQFNDINNEINKIKKEQEETIRNFETQKEKELSILENKKDDYKKELKEIEKELTQLKKISIYEYSKIEYDLDVTSSELKSKLEILKLDEKELISNDQALTVDNNMTKKAIREQSKQILRNFNSETQILLLSLNFKNIDTTKNKLIKSYENLNKIYKIDGVSLNKELLELKLKQFDLIVAEQIKKQEEKEQQQAIKEQMKEEERVRKEIEIQKQKIEKEESQFNSEMKKLMSYMSKANNDIETQIYADKIKELEEKLRLLENDKKNVLEREANTRAGFVYIISNVGSFGENVYKIGMTRRLEPMDRVKELSSASVPFEFDVHAMIFSDDAPALENMLHTEFKNYQVNKINPRKEFFRVDIKEIEAIVKEKFNATTEFTLLAKAEQYRETLKLESQLS